MICLQFITSTPDQRGVLYINVTKGSQKTVWTINILVSAFSVW